MTRPWQLAAAIGFCALGMYIGHDALVGALGRTLVCEEGALTADVIFLDSFDNEFRLFRRAADLQRSGIASRVLIPVIVTKEQDATAAANEVTNALARVAKLSRWENIPVYVGEPISLNAAYQVRDYLLSEHISAVTLISPGFRSKRSELIYRSVLGESGIKISCEPVLGTMSADAWTNTWHGIEEVGLQFMKLQYYRFWVMPVVRR